MLFKLSSGICCLAAVLSLSLMPIAGNAAAADGSALSPGNQTAALLVKKASNNKFRHTSSVSNRRTSAGSASRITTVPFRANAVIRPPASLSRISSGGSISSGMKIPTLTASAGSTSGFSGTKITRPNSTITRLSASLVRPLNTASNQSVLQANKPAKPQNSAIMDLRSGNNRPAGTLTANLNGITQTSALNKPVSSNGTVQTPALTYPNKPVNTPNKITNTVQQNTGGMIQNGNGNTGKIQQGNITASDSTKPGNNNSSGKQTNGAVLAQNGNLNNGTISQLNGNGKLGDKPGNSTTQQNTGGMIQNGNGNTGKIQQGNITASDSTKPGNNNSSGKQTNGAVLAQNGNLNNGTISQLNGNGKLGDKPGNSTTQQNTGGMIQNGNGNTGKIQQGNITASDSTKPGNGKPDDSPGKKPGPIVTDPVKKPEDKKKTEDDKKNPSNTNKTNNADIDQIGDNNSATIQQADQITNINQTISNNPTIVNASSTKVVERPVVVAQPTIIAAAPQPAQVFIPVPSGNSATDCRDRAVRLNEKGLISSENRDFVEAEQYFKLALEVLEGCDQKDYGLMATTLENLAIIYERLGRLEDSAKARNLANRVKAMA